LTGVHFFRRLAASFLAFRFPEVFPLPDFLAFAVLAELAALFLAGAFRFLPLWAFELPVVCVPTMPPSKAPVAAPSGPSSDPAAAPVATPTAALVVPLPAAPWPDVLPPDFFASVLPLAISRPPLSR
jgi:hypothetical protein